MSMFSLVGEIFERRFYVLLKMFYMFHLFVITVSCEECLYENTSHLTIHLG